MGEDLMCERQRRRQQERIIFPSVFWHTEEVNSQMV